MMTYQERGKFPPYSEYLKLQILLRDLIQSHLIEISKDQDALNAKVTQILHLEGFGEY